MLGHSTYLHFCMGSDSTTMAVIFLIFLTVSSSKFISTDSRVGWMRRLDRVKVLSWAAGHGLESYSEGSDIMAGHHLRLHPGR